MPDQSYHFPARVMRQAAPAADALLERYRQRYPSSDITPFFLPVEISNNSLDWYYTHMRTSSLQNYAADAESGVAFQDSHRTGNLGYGRSLYGLYSTEPGSPPGWDRLSRRGDAALPAIAPPEQYERVVSAAYIIPGLRLNLASYATTDDFIRAVDGGAVEQVSIGFGGGRETCDICGANYWSYDCSHIAGMTYEVERGDQRGVNLATVAIHDARLLEFSAVYAGATPNAMVVRKAEQENEAGRLSPKQAEWVEARYRVKIITRNWSGADLSKPIPTEDDMSLEQVRALLSEAGLTGDDALAQARAAVQRIAELEPLADQGRQYRADLIADALAQGVAANGDKFSEETYRGILERASIEHIKQMRNDWQRLANERYPGGRHTNNGDQPDEQPESEPAAPVARKYPASAYKA